MRRAEKLNNIKGIAADLNLNSLEAISALLYIIIIESEREMLQIKAGDRFRFSNRTVYRVIRIDTDDFVVHTINRKIGEYRCHISMFRQFIRKTEKI